MDPFVNAIAIPDLGAGAAYALWGFRATAIGHVSCCALVRGYDDALGEFGKEALSGLVRFVRILGLEGGRKISLAEPGYSQVTADELSVVATLAAAQAGDADRLDAHLRWLLAGFTENEAHKAAQAVAVSFQRAGLRIDPPPVHLSAQRARKTFIVHHAAGTA